jgi:hypothetical protein
MSEREGCIMTCLIALAIMIGVVIWGAYDLISGIINTWK